MEGERKDNGVPRLRSVRQGCCGPWKGPCFDNVLEGRDVSVMVVWYSMRTTDYIVAMFTTGFREVLHVCLLLLSVSVVHA